MIRYRIVIDNDGQQAEIFNVSRKIYLEKAVLTRQINDGMFDASLDITVLPDNPGYESVKLLKSTVYAYENDAELFRGRAVKITMGLKGRKNISCEGELKFLLDVPDVFSLQTTGQERYYIGTEKEMSHEYMTTIPTGKMRPSYRAPTTSVAGRYETNQLSRFGEKRQYQFPDSSETKTVYRNQVLSDNAMLAPEPYGKRVSTLTEWGRRVGLMGGYAGNTRWTDYLWGLATRSVPGGHYRSFTVRYAENGGSIKEYVLPMGFFTYDVEMLDMWGSSYDRLYMPGAIYNTVGSGMFIGNFGLIYDENSSFVRSVQGYDPDAQVMCNGSQISLSEVPFCIVHYGLVTHWEAYGARNDGTPALYYTHKGHEDIIYAVPENGNVMTECHISMFRADTANIADMARMMFCPSDQSERYVQADPRVTSADAFYLRADGGTSYINAAYDSNVEYRRGLAYDIPADPQPSNANEVQNGWFDVVTSYVSHAGRDIRRYANGNVIYYTRDFAGGYQEAGKQPINDTQIGDGWYQNVTSLVPSITGIEDDIDNASGSAIYYVEFGDGYTYANPQPTAETIGSGNYFVKWKRFYKNGSYVVKLTGSDNNYHYYLVPYDSAATYYIRTTGLTGYNAYVPENRRIYRGTVELQGDVSNTSVDTCYSNLRKWLSETGGYAAVIHKADGTPEIYLTGDSGDRSDDFYVELRKNLQDANKTLTCDGIVTGMYVRGVMTGENKTDDSEEETVVKDEDYELLFDRLNVMQKNGWWENNLFVLQDRSQRYVINDTENVNFERNQKYLFSAGKWVPYVGNPYVSYVTVKNPAEMTDTSTIYQYTGMDVNYIPHKVYWYNGAADAWQADEEAVAPTAADGFTIDYSTNMIWHNESKAEYGAVVGYLEVDCSGIPAEYRMQHLVDKAQEAIREKLTAFESLDISAVDPRLIGLDGKTPVLGNYYRVTIPWLGIEGFKRLTKIVTDMIKPSGSKLTFGEKQNTLSDYIAKKGERL